MFRLPAAMVWTCGGLIAIHVLRALLTPRSDIQLYQLLAFVPARLTLAVLGDWGQQALLGVTGLVTHALLHANLTHLVVNLGFMAAFGAECARRLGPVRLGIFMIVAAVAGGLGQFLAGPGDVSPMVGASDIVSAFMGVFVRVAFRPRSSITLSDFDAEGRLAPRAASILATLTNRQAVGFIAVMAAANVAMVVFGSALTGEGGRIAWAAHLGGFLAGFLLYGLFEPPRQPARLPVKMPANDP